RMLAPSAALITGHGAGNGAPPDLDWAALARGARTIVLYMARDRLGAIAQALLAAGRAPDEPVALLPDATTARQRAVRTTLGEAAGAAGLIEPGAATLVVLGPVVALGDVLGATQQVGPARVLAAPRVAAAQGGAP